MEFTITDVNGYELGYLAESASIDIDIGDTNDFELILSREYSEKLGVKNGFQFFSPGTEYGGIIEDIQSETLESNITYTGYTWRGLLEKIIIEPPEGKAYRIVEGEANKIIKQILNNGPGLLFEIPEEDSGILISSYQFDRYVTALKGLNDMLEEHKARLDIKAVEGNENEPLRVIVKAVKVNNYSEEIQFDGDNNVNVKTRDYRRGINHLICLGSGELEERMVVHLYARLDGSVSKKQYYKGKDERTDVYDYSSVEDKDELIKSGKEQLKSLMNYKSAKMSLNDSEEELELGDIVSARDRDAGIILSNPVVNKIVQYSNGKESIEYKLKGEE